MSSEQDPDTTKFGKSDSPPTLFIHVNQKELDQILSIRNQATAQISDPEQRKAAFVALLVHFLGLEKEWIPRLQDPEERWLFYLEKMPSGTTNTRVSTIH